MLFKNQNTGEEVNVSNLTIKNDRIFFTVRGKGCGQRFLNRNTCLVLDEHVEDGTYLKTAEGWEVIKKKKTNGERKPKAEKPQPQPEPADEPTDAVEVVEEEPKEENAHEVENVHTTNESTKDEQALINAIKNLRGGAVDTAKVEEIVCNVLNRMAKDDPKKVSAVVKKARQNAKKEGEVYCEKFERIVAKVARGNNVYLFGRAGSGKSHTAEQVAERLGLDFYGQTTIQFAHDVRGYGDAGGNFQETPFFKAFANGGLYFQDEYDRSNSEAAIVLNSALANGWYDFPIVGRVNAHPNFRFMAAGNTLMKGADEEYVTGQIIDASSRDRFGFFFEVDYSHEVELKIAGGNEEIVAFVEDIREAIKSTGIQQVVSYRATAAMRDEVENENDKEACIVESVCKGLEKDEIREIYGALKNKENAWAKAMKKAF